MSETDSPDWGKGFSSSHEASTISNNGHEFAFYLAGYYPIRGDREDLEKEPDRILTERELQSTDALVIHFTGIGYKTFASGPWEDWEELWEDLQDFYDVYES